jgi:hypothetical protein
MIRKIEIFLNGSNDNNLEKQFSSVEIYEIDDNGNILNLIHSSNHPVMSVNPEK